MDIPDKLLLEIAHQFGTPAYVYDLDALDERLRQLQQALPAARIRYAVKANSAAAVLRRVAAAGAGAEVITLGELGRALAAGIPPEKLILGGPAQAAALRSQALDSRVALTSLDSESQWDDWQETLAAHPDRQPPGFLVRVNPALDPHTHRHLATGAADSKFGLLPEAAARLAGRVRRSGLFRGFHVHAGSQIADLKVFRGVLDALAPLHDAHGGTILNFGGGYRVPDFPLKEYAELVGGFAAERGLELLVEPGRWLVAGTGGLLGTVLHVKEGPVTHVIADAGMADLLRPALYDAQHPIRLLGDTTGRQPVTVDVDGPLCENSDRLGRNRQLPGPRKGDILLVGEAGAYGMGMASNYASSLRPAEVAVSGGQARLVRRREEVADLLAAETL